MSNQVAFVVYGTPAPAGSKRAVRAGAYIRVIDANRNAAPWKQEVARAALHAMGDAPRFDGPIAVVMTFFRRRPAAHYRTNGLVKPSAPLFPTGKPDALKLARGCEDAMSGLVYRDDAQIVIETLNKRYGEPERVEITVWELDEIGTVDQWERTHVAS